MKIRKYFEMSNSKNKSSKYGMWLKQCIEENLASKLKKSEKQLSKYTS